MSLSTDQWDISHLRQHLQYAVDLEFWTIPFYMSAMYSIIDRSSKAYQLIRTVVNQEMLHLQSAANIANAYGLSPTLDAPVYEGKKVPHLDFSGDDPEEVDKFKPYTAEIGPLDLERVNAMCLVEIPESLTDEPPQLNEHVTEYGSIGQFYQAVTYGAAQLTDELQGGVKQADYFSAFYRNMPNLTVTQSGKAGFDQVALLIQMITDQGEGGDKKSEYVRPVFENTADDREPTGDHFYKFLSIKNEATKKEPTFPPVYEAKPVSAYTERDKALEATLIAEFTRLRGALGALFDGKDPGGFFPVMAAVGGAIRNCWVNGVTPKYS